MKVLLTGASGFIGKHVINYFSNREGIEIIATDNDFGTIKNNEWFNKIMFIKYDFSEITDENLFSKFKNPDKIIHLAWDGLANFKDNIHINKVLPKQKLFLSNLIRNGAKDITITGTCLEYGMTEGELHEQMNAEPIIAYPIAKNELRLFLNGLKNDFSFKLKWIRLFYLYGEGQNPKSILSQLQKAIDNNDAFFNMSKGDQLRDYLPVSKVAENIAEFAIQEKYTGIVNCCSNKPISVLQLVKDYMREKNKNIELNLGYFTYPDYEPLNFWGSNKKLLKILNQYD